MNKNIFILTFAMIIISLVIGCTSDIDNIQDEEINSHRELFAFSNTESVNSTIESYEVYENGDNDNQPYETTETLQTEQTETLEDYPILEVEQDDEDANTQFGNITDNELLNPMVVLVGGIDNVPPPPSAVNIDFTVFSGEEFDEEYFSLMWETENSFGKIVRVIGTYNGFFDEPTNRYLHYVLIDDAEGCCVLFFEFKWNEDNITVAFPEEGAIIDLTGVFGEYYCDIFELSFQYLNAVSLSILQAGE